MFTLNALLYTLTFVAIAFGVTTLWPKAPLGQRVHAAAVLINTLTFIAGAWSPTSPFFQGRSPRLVGWAVGLSVVLVAMAIIARYQRTAQPWFRPSRSAFLSAIPLLAFAAALVTLSR